MPYIRSQRRSLALAAGSLLLAAQLSACGFSNATEEIYQASAGVDYRKGPVDVLSAVIVSGQDGSGTFIASFANNSVKEAAQVEEISAAATEQAVEVVGFEPIDVPPGGLVNLANDPRIRVQGDFTAGQYVDLTIAFANADTGDVEMSVPVVAATNQYEGLDVTTSESASESPSESPSEPASESPSESPSEPVSETPSE